MADSVQEKKFILYDFNKSLLVLSGNSNKMTVTKIPLHVLEMEDVCFHDGSALLLLDAPIGSSEGGASADNQKKVSGTDCLVLVFRHFQENPNKKLLITGHDDTNGSARQGFTISKLRAEGVLRLLEGDKSAWVKHAAANHTIKDYQQYLKYFHYTRGCNCDPGEVDGLWGKSTEAAIRAYFSFVNNTGVLSAALDIQMVTQNPGKLWPVKVWNHVYDVYEHAIFSMLIGSRWTPADAERERHRLSFVDPSKPYVACGESFPIDKVGKDNYRSQKNRRVEFLFFDDNKIPPLPLQCPSQTNKNHTKEECPFYKTAYYKREYIKIDDINTVLYHLKFTYFDKILNKWMDVPDGLYVKAFKAGKEVITTCRSRNGIYYVRLMHSAGGKRDDDVHFVIESKNAWVYTKDKNSLPVLAYSFNDKAGTPITREELAKRPLAERMHYYDLPEIWDSRNWFCKVDQKDGDFKTLVTEITSVTAPMTFCWDDIVLVDENGSQLITDKDQNDSAVPLSRDSRISLFYVDKSKLLLFAPEFKNAPYFSNVPFDKNIIHCPPAKTLTIAFANDFHTVDNFRSEKNVDIKKGQLLGARIAQKKTRFHYGEKLEAHKLAGYTLFYADYCGNFELHYFHHADMQELDGNVFPISFLMVYWSARVTANSSDTPTNEQVERFAKDGMMNVKKRWEDKDYVIEPQSSLLRTHKIIPVFFIEVKKKYSGGREKCALTISSDEAAGCMGATDGDMYYKDYDVNDYLQVGTYIDIDGKKYGVFTAAHEIGHATGKADEYSYDFGDINKWARNAEDGPFSQYYPGMPYRIDDSSMMWSNRAPRMRHYWFFVNWINECAKDVNKLKACLNSDEFKISYKFGKTELNYFLPGTGTDLRNIYQPAFFERNVNTGTGTVDIALYKIGNDETSKTLKVTGRTSKQAWDSICVVFIKIGVSFGYDSLPAGGNKYILQSDGTPKLWESLLRGGVSYKNKWIAYLNDKLLKLNNKFWVEDLGASNRLFRNTIVHFFPIVLIDPYKQFNTSGQLTESINLRKDNYTNFNISVNFNDSASIIKRQNNNLDVGCLTSASWIARYIIGQDDNDSAPSGNVITSAADLKFIENWLKHKINISTIKLNGS